MILVIAGSILKFVRASKHEKLLRESRKKPKKNRRAKTESKPERIMEGKIYKDGKFVSQKVNPPFFERFLTCFSV